MPRDAGPYIFPYFHTVKNSEISSVATFIFFAELDDSPVSAFA